MPCLLLLLVLLPRKANHKYKEDEDKEKEVPVAGTKVFSSLSSFLLLRSFIFFFDPSSSSLSPNVFMLRPVFVFLTNPWISHIGRDQPRGSPRTGWAWAI